MIRCSTFMQVKCNPGGFLYSREAPNVERTKKFKEANVI